ncbi:MAG: class I SAM-dependent methyltransferase, partial [Actinomycetota bacterium]
MLGSPRASPSAENVAAVRAFLTRRGILDDVYAERFVRRRKRVAVDSLASFRGPARSFSWIAARTKFYDQLVIECLDAGIRQVVIVGAGYDARAWRFARDDVRFVEVDHPATQERKKALAPPGGPEYVAADLSVQRLADALASRLTPGEPVLVTCEGLTPYLHETAVRSLLSQAAELCPAGSRLGVEFGTKAVAAGPLRLRWVPVVMRVLQRWSGEPLQLELQQEEVPALLRDTGLE